MYSILYMHSVTRYTVNVSINIRKQQVHIKHSKGSMDERIQLVVDYCLVIRVKGISKIQLV